MTCTHETTPRVMANGLTYNNRIRYVAVCSNCGLILMQGTHREFVENRENYPENKEVC